MMVIFRNFGRWLGIAALAITIWLVWWCQGERQVRRAQRRLLNAIEAHDNTALTDLLANDYRDGWEHDKTFVLTNCKRFVEMIPALDIGGEVRSVEEKSGDYWLRQKITVTGLGPVGAYAREEMAKLNEPFTMRWRKRSWKPWDWELIWVEQPEFKFPSF